MKLIYTPVNTNQDFVVEGDPNEIIEFISLMTDQSTAVLAPAKTSRSHPTVARPTSNTTDDKTVPVEPKSVQFAGTEREAFLQSIYVYEPNKHNDNGRGSFVAREILKHGRCNIASLAAKSNGNLDTVYKAIKRMQEAGAKFDITATTVTLTEIPAGPFTRLRRRQDSVGPRAVTTQVINSRTNGRATPVKAGSQPRDNEVLQRASALRLP